MCRSRAGVLVWQAARKPAAVASTPLARQRHTWREFDTKIVENSVNSSFYEPYQEHVQNPDALQSGAFVDTVIMENLDENVHANKI